MNVITLLLLVLGWQNPSVLITPDWIKGPGPYVLDKANTTYVLTTDVAVDGTAFIVGAANVSLDLGGRTITHANAAPIAFVNGGFEDGAAGWDCSKAPASKIASARVGMWGKSMLSLPGFASTQTIVSSPVKIPTAGRSYAATITPRGTGNVSVSLRVLDAAGVVLGTATVKPEAVARGFAAVAHFVPAAVGEVRLRIDCDVVDRKPGSVDLDYAGVFHSYDHAIIASRKGYELPAQLKQFKAVSERTNGFSVTNGTIRAGRSRSYAALSINARQQADLRVSQVDSFVNGMDANNVESSAGGVQIRDCKFSADVENVSDRMAVFGAVDVQNNTGVEISRNEIVGVPQCGIVVSSNEPGSKVAITGNYVRQNTIVSNGYGILLDAVHDFTVGDNSVAPINGQGIGLDNWGAEDSDNGEIFSNSATARLRPNLECGLNMEAMALRLRAGKRTQRSVRVRDNQFTSYTGPGWCPVAIGCRITQWNDKGQATAANNLIENNTFKAIADAPDKGYSAWAISLTRVDAGTGLTLAGNTLVSNDICLNVGDESDYEKHNADVTFSRTQFVKATEGANRPHLSVMAGLFRTSCTAIRLNDSVFGEGAGPIVIDPYPAPKELVIGQTQVVVVKTLRDSGSTTVK